METIDDWWAFYCSINTHDEMLFIQFLQENEAFGLSASVWQCFHNTFLDYLEMTQDATSFYVWLKSENLILN